LGFHLCNCKQAILPLLQANPEFLPQKKNVFGFYYKHVMTYVAPSCCFEPTWPPSPPLWTEGMRFPCFHACPTFFSQAKVCRERISFKIRTAVKVGRKAMNFWPLVLSGVSGIVRSNAYGFMYVS